MTITKVMKTKHSIYNINYHIVFCPKYHHSILKNEVEQQIKNVFGMICFNYGYELLEMEIMPDHCHLFISPPPTIAPVDIVKTLKSVSALHIFRTFPDLKRQKFWGSGLWSKGYYIGTAGSVSAETIQRYIQNQKLV